MAEKTGAFTTFFLQRGDGFMNHVFVLAPAATILCVVGEIFLLYRLFRPGWPRWSKLWYVLGLFVLPLICDLIFKLSPVIRWERCLG